MTFVSRSVADTYAIAKKIAKDLVGGEIILLEGELGAGKTTFTKGLALALGIKDEVVSPTFIMMREYQGSLPLYHFDLYRIDDEQELEELGLREYLYGNGICVIEWNKFSDFPKKTLQIKIQRIDDNSRSIEIK
jgi:tRNA threonylcarbamoyladenosine biosynthesis protein TsaE